MDINQALERYRVNTAFLISYVQAFNLHHRYPETFKCPNIEEAEACWRKANADNLLVCEYTGGKSFEETKKGLSF